MRILVVHSRYASGDMSGENRVVDDEVRLLRGAGHDVTTFLPSVAGGSVLDRVRASLDAVWAKESLRRLAQLTASSTFDVVHCHNLFPMVSPAFLRAIPPDSLTVLTLHNFRLLCLPATLLRDGRICEDCVGRSTWRGVTHACYRDSTLGSATLAASISLHRSIGTLRTVDRFLAVSEFVRRKHVQGGLPASKIRVKDNFVPAATRRKGSGEFFLVVSRLSPEKGVTELVEAWRAIDHDLVVAGDGPEMEKVAAKAPANVRLLGAVTPDRVQSLLQRARAVLVPSICYEGAPRVIPEAFAAGVPVIATRIGGLSNMVTHATNGYLVGLGQTREWQMAVDKLSDTSLNMMFGREAHKSWKTRFTPEGAVRSLEQAYTR